MTIIQGGVKITGYVKFTANYAPDAPTKLQASWVWSSTSSLVTLTLLAPAYRGSGAVTSYTVISSPSGYVTTTTVTPSASSAVLSLRVNPNNLYQFYAYATNFAGNSVLSTASNLVLPYAFTNSSTYTTDLVPVPNTVTSVQTVLTLEPTTGAAGAIISFNTGTAAYSEVVDAGIYLDYSWNTAGIDASPAPTVYPNNYSTSSLVWSYTGVGGSTPATGSLDVRTVALVGTGKYYTEIQFDASEDNLYVGMTYSGGQGYNNYTYVYWYTGRVYVGATQSGVDFGARYTTPSQRMMIAWDATAGKVWFGFNGSWQSGRSPGDANGITIPTNSGYLQIVFAKGGAATLVASGSFKKPSQFAYSIPAGFTAYYNGSVPTLSYTAVSTPGCISVTTATVDSSANPKIYMYGLVPLTTYTFKVKATNAGGTSALSTASASTTTYAAAGADIFPYGGNWTWIKPPGVTRVSAVVVGAGSDSGATSQATRQSYFWSSSVLNVTGSTGGGFTNGSSAFGGQGQVGAGITGAGYAGGNGVGFYAPGAAGYAGCGPDGGSATTPGSGAGGSGGYGVGSGYGYAAGGGVGLFGIGADGVQGISNNASGVGTGGGGGSGGQSANNADGVLPEKAGLFGGGGAGYCGQYPYKGGGAGGLVYGNNFALLDNTDNYTVKVGTPNGSAANGGVRVIYPGQLRAFPSTFAYCFKNSNNYQFIPSPPFNITAVANSGTRATISYTASSFCGGSAITSYTAVSNPGNVKSTTASGIIVVDGLTPATAYTFQVYATNSYGNSNYEGQSISTTTYIAAGSTTFSQPGSYTWKAPAGVTKVSIVAVGGGGGGGSNIGGGGAAGGQSYFYNACVVKGGGGGRSGGTVGTYVGTGGGNGGLGVAQSGGGGGAGGYSGAGGKGSAGTGACLATAGSGGGGGGGGKGTGQSAGGGGVGLFGQGTGGAAGPNNFVTGVGTGGGGGSGGLDGCSVICFAENRQSGGMFGGGAGGDAGGAGGSGGGLGYLNNYGVTPGNCYPVVVGDGGPNYGEASRGGGGAVRIVWPGEIRQFPSTGVNEGWGNDTSTIASSYVPNAPISLSAVANSGTSVSVYWNVPIPVRLNSSVITSYTLVETNYGITQTVTTASGYGATGGNVVVGTVNDLQPLTTYSFVVYANNVYGVSTASLAVSTTTYVAAGSMIYTTPGSYTFKVPSNVTSLSMVAVGGGGGGLGSSQLFSTSARKNGGDSSIGATGLVVAAGGIGSAFVNGGSISYGSGGSGTSSSAAGAVGNSGGAAGDQGGGGAGGYAGAGGAGATTPVSAGSGGGGGGGGYNASIGWGGGGGVGLFGQTTNGAAGNSTGNPGTTIYGGGGSNGLSASSSGGGLFGGGGSGGHCGAAGGGGQLVYLNNYGVSPDLNISITVGAGGDPAGNCPAFKECRRGANGAVRIVWPGQKRQFPSTGVGESWGYDSATINSSYVPSPPTITSAIANSGTAITVFYNTSTYKGGAAVTSYTAIAQPGNRSVTTSGYASNSIKMFGLSPLTEYTINVYATNDYGNGAYSDSVTTTTMVANGDFNYVTVYGVGSFSWTAPAGVTSVSAVAVGGGGAGYDYFYRGGGGGGGLGWKNNITVVPFTTYTVFVGRGGFNNGSACGDGLDSYFISTSTVRGGGGKRASGSLYSTGVGGTYTGDGGGAGGAGGAITGVGYGSGGGGAGGYSGNGGAGGCAANNALPGNPGTGGGGGGGGTAGNSVLAGPGGGGVGLFGQGANGAGGTTSTVIIYGSNFGRGFPGGGGSPAAAGAYLTGEDGYPDTSSGSPHYYGGQGGYPGGGGGTGSTIPCYSISLYGTGGLGANGAVRIIWPGQIRQFPNTLTVAWSLL